MEMGKYIIGQDIAGIPLGGSPISFRSGLVAEGLTLEIHLVRRARHQRDPVGR